MALSDKAKEFANSIILTKEYSALKQAWVKIGQNKALKTEMDSFLKIQNQALSKGPSRESEIELNRKFQQLSKYPEVSNFLRANKQYNDMLANTYNMINQIIENDLKLL